MDGYVLSAEEQAKVIRRSYNRTRAYVQSEIEKILHHVGDKDSPAYEYRMKRLASLLQNTEKRIKELYGITLEDTTSFLKSIIPEAYYHTIFDIAQGTGEEPMFSAVNTKLIDSIVKEPWSGQNYSKRIWNNTNKLADEVREVLTEAAQSGESISKTSKKLADAFNTSQYNAERLIRTETTYACNQAEIAGYKELDIDKYRFVATLDTRTSPICQKLDGKVFPTDKAQAGKNLPSMHPNCRSTTIPEFEEGMPEFRTARDKDGNRITVPADMTYPEWYDKYVKPKEEQNAPKTPSKSPKGKDTTPKPEAAKTPQKPPERAPEKPPAEVEIPAPKQSEPEFVDTPIPKRPTEVPRPEPKKAEETAPKATAAESKKPKPYTKVVDTVEGAREFIGTIFGSISDSVKGIAKELLIDNAEQLRKLNNRFGALTSANKGFFSGTRQKGNTIAATSASIKHIDVSLTLSDKYYRAAETLISAEKGMQEAFHSMPIAEEYTKVASITHEYGHILENEIIKSRIDPKKYQELFEMANQHKDLKLAQKGRKLLEKEETAQAKKIFEEILGIAREKDKDLTLTRTLSAYGRKNYFEAFAEIFMNSQCGAPNELGKTMQMWLERQGL